MAKRDVPAPYEGAGEPGRTKTTKLNPEYRPWARPEISNLPFAVDHAARQAAAFAEVVFEGELEAAGLDWASRVQHRCDAPPAALTQHLPPGIIPVVRREAERMLRLWPM
ncbi:hypothetical protein [Erythrobacter sp. AP23]|uniref:hypothetical protein n=1 Tax=Erythrobacter sp. AP23 TaxID=499656 RepID=UPI00076BDD27|nr:hypothetical protein [Erythrobacter sp. AP23]KWV95940.1 hypothetical protein ASS64_01580 [Erythrobacter sp. AP23]